MKLNILLLSFLISVSSLAQVAERAEDISPLLIGEKVPQIKISSVENKKISLIDVVKKRPTMLLFYRGGWCPYCNAHLAAVGEITEEIRELGYQIIAVSPDSPEKLKESLENQDMDYQLFSDADGNLIKAMGLAFQANDKYVSMLSDRSGGENSGFLPVPALFIVDTKGTIVFEYISPDYSQRIAAPLLLDVLKHFSGKK